ncbi:MAG: PD40 domain-containing protein [Saprospiraceae bacterium]|nr:PD40 domain-containing protein [Saprospiraceae bacterium]
MFSASRIASKILLSSLLAGLSALQAQAQTNTPADPFPATAVPLLLAPGVISSPDPEFGLALIDGNTQLYFNRSSPDRSRMLLLESRLANGQWMPPQVPAFSDTSFWDIDPCWLPSDRSILFSSNRPLPGSSSSDFNLWLAAADDRAPTALGPGVNSPADEVFCSVSRTKNLYFARFNGRKAAIYRYQMEQAPGQVPERLVFPGLDSTISVSNPAISPDERYLVFASGDLPGLGSADLFISRRLPDGGWSRPRNLGESLNSAFTEFAPAFSADGKTLFFTSERPGVVQDFPAGKRRPGDLYHISLDALLDKLGPEYDPTDSTVARLEAINRDIWAPFAAAYATADAELYNSLHSPDFIRASGDGIFDLNTYAQQNKAHFQRSKDKGARISIRFAFTERLVERRFASERGIYHYRSDNGKGQVYEGYGKFHVVERLENGRWKILFDYDSDESGSIDQADFDLAYAPDDWTVLSKPGFDREAVRVQIEQANQSYGERFRTRDTAWYAARYTADACILPEKSPRICGLEGIIGYYYGQGDNQSLQLRITTLELSGGPETMLEEGLYELLDDKGALLDKGKFIATWVPEGGRWKLRREIWTTDLAPKD